MYAHNKNICLKLRNICFVKFFIDSLKITLQVIKFTSQFAECEARICNLISMGLSLFDLKQVECVTKLVKLKVSFRLDKWLDESEVGLKVFISKSSSKSKVFIFIAEHC